jgi:hypothetical protein
LGKRSSYNATVCENDFGFDEEIKEEPVCMRGVAFTPVKNVTSYSDTEIISNATRKKLLLRKALEAREEGGLNLPGTDTMTHCPLTLLEKLKC